jgi:hypothetical protein
MTATEPRFSESVRFSRWSILLSLPTVALVWAVAYEFLPREAIFEPIPLAGVVLLSGFLLGSGVFGQRKRYEITVSDDELSVEVNYLTELVSLAERAVDLDPEDIASVSAVPYQPYLLVRWKFDNGLYMRGRAGVHVETKAGESVYIPSERRDELAEAIEAITAES